MTVNELPQSRSNGLNLDETVRSQVSLFEYVGATPRTGATPRVARAGGALYSRRIVFAPDLQTGNEEEDNREATRGRSNNRLL